MILLLNCFGKHLYYTNFKSLFHLFCHFFLIFKGIVHKSIFFVVAVCLVRTLFIHICGYLAALYSFIHFFSSNLYRSVMSEYDER